MKSILFTALLALVLAFPATAQQYGETQQPMEQQQTAETQQNGGAEELPAAASPLPLAGLGGLASLAAGYWLARRRK